MRSPARVGGCEQGLPSRSGCRVGICLPAVKVTPDAQPRHQQISATASSFWKAAPNGDGEAGLWKDLYFYSGPQEWLVSDVVPCVLRFLAPTWACWGLLVDLECV